MTKKIIVAVAIVVSLLAVSLGGAIFYATKVLTPEKLQHYAQAAVEKSMPNATLKLANIELRFGLTIKAYVRDLELKLNEKYQSMPLLKFQEAVIRIPLWAIITGGGTAVVKLQSPIINYQQLPTKDNWSLAFEGKAQAEAIPNAQSAAAKETKDKSDESIAVPAMAAAIKLDIQLNDLILNYQLRDKSKGSLLLERFVLKQLSLIGTTAFEVRSNFKYLMKNGEQYQINSMLIGEFSLADFFATGAINSKMQLTLQDIKLGNTGLVIPTIKTNLSLLMNKSGEVKSEIVTSFSSSKIVTTIGISKNGSIDISNIKMNILIADLLAIVKDKAMPFAIDAGASTLNVDGQVRIESSKIFPKIQFSLAPSLKTNIDGIAAALNAHGSYNGDKLILNSSIELLKGLIATEILANFDINQKELKIEKLKPFKIQSKLTNLELDESLIRGKLYSNSKPALSPVASTAEVTEGSKPAASLPLLPPGIISLELSNVKIAEQALNGKGKITITNKSISTDFLNIAYAGGQLDLTHKTVLGAKGNNSDFALSLASFNLLGIRPFLPPFVDAVTGIFSGKVKGSVGQGRKGVSYAIDTKLQARSGAIQGLKIGQFLEGYADKLPMLKGKQFNIESEKLANYEVLNFDAKLTDHIYQIKSVEFIAINKLVELKGSGEIYPPPTKGMSKLNLTYRDSKYLSRVLKEATKSDILPVQLSGVEFALAPDYSYTTQALMKGAGKKAAEKVIDKAKEALKSNGKKEVKKLFKSFGL